MRSLFEELGGTYTLGKDGMYYPNLAIEETDQRSIGKWGRMHRKIPEGAVSEPLSTAPSEWDFGQASCRYRRKGGSDA